jgi:hypothetical protein
MDIEKRPACVALHSPWPSRVSKNDGKQAANQKNNQTERTPEFSHRLVTVRYTAGGTMGCWFGGLWNTGHTAGLCRALNKKILINGTYNCIIWIFLPAIRALFH